MADGRFIGRCCGCKSEMWLPEPLYQAAMHGKGKIAFYCPYGHGQVFTQGESEETILRRERDRLKQEQARLHDIIDGQQFDINNLKHLVGKEKAKVSKLEQRASKGVCACCNRSFANVARHMKTKHPEFKAVRVA